MTLEHANGVVRAVFTGLIGGVQTANVMHIRNQTGAPWSQSDINALTSGLNTKFATRFPPLVTALWTFTGVKTVDLSSMTGVVGNATSAVVGSLSTSGVNAATAQCITWKTAAHYRGGHCRTYLPPPAGTDITAGNTWAGSTASVLQTAANNWIADVSTIATSEAITLILLRRTANKVPLVPPLTFNITSAVVDSRVDTMRRRLGRDR